MNNFIKILVIYFFIFNVGIVFAMDSSLDEEQKKSLTKFSKLVEEYSKNKDDYRLMCIVNYYDRIVDLANGENNRKRLRWRLVDCLGKKKLFIKDLRNLYYKGLVVVNKEQDIVKNFKIELIKFAQNNYQGKCHLKNLIDLYNQSQSLDMSYSDKESLRARLFHLLKEHNLSIKILKDRLLSPLLDEDRLYQEFQSDEAFKEFAKLVNQFCVSKNKYALNKILSSHDKLMHITKDKKKINRLRLRAKRLLVNKVGMSIRELKKID